MLRRWFALALVFSAMLPGCGSSPVDPGSKGQDGPGQRGSILVRPPAFDPWAGPNSGLTPPPPVTP